MYLLLPEVVSYSVAGSSLYTVGLNVLKIKMVCVDVSAYSPVAESCSASWLALPVIECLSWEGWFENSALHVPVV